MPKFSFTTYLYRGPTEREYEVEVTYSVTPFVPAVLYGDCPQPAEGGEVELQSITGQLEWAELTEVEVDRLYDEACDRADSDLVEWHAEAEEYRAEMRREDREARASESIPARKYA